MRFAICDLRLLIAYCLLPTAYCLLPTAYCLLPTTHCLNPDPGINRHYLISISQQRINIHLKDLRCCCQEVEREVITFMNAFSLIPLLPRTPFITMYDFSDLIIDRASLSETGARHVATSLKDLDKYTSHSGHDEVAELILSLCAAEELPA